MHDAPENKIEAFITQASVIECEHLQAAVRCFQHIANVEASFPRQPISLDAVTCLKVQRY